MTAAKQRRRPGHCLDVQLVFYPPYVFFCERLLAPRDLIKIHARDRIMAGVEIPRSALDAENRDVGWKKVVEAAPDRVGRLTDFRSRLEMHDLRQGMHTRVGPAGALHFEIVAKH